MQPYLALSEKFGVRPEPLALRREIEREVMRLADVYKLTINQEPPEEDNDAWASVLFGDKP